jgi:hypothetical protein
MIVGNDVGERVAGTVRLLVAEGRWSPSLEALLSLYDLERFLAIRIQAGQPALEAMNASLAAQSALALISSASAALATGEIASPTCGEMGLLGPSIVSEELPLAA